jgi:hypothetical protein
METWIQNTVQNVLFPLLVGGLTYLLVAKLDEWKKRRSYSKLGAAIIESLIEEVKTGIAILDDVQNPQPTATPSLLPKKSWNGMTTIPDEVLLRIIEVSDKVIPKSFHPREIRIHCKNYFEHITSNWEQDLMTGKWMLKANRYSIPMRKVLEMLTQTKHLLIMNSKRWMPQ